MTRFRWIARLFPAAVVCLSLAGCLFVSDKAGLERNIARDPSLVGEWEVLQWFSRPGSYKGSDRFFRIEERLHDGKHVYEIISKNPQFKAYTKDFFTVYRFGDNRYVLNGRPQNCDVDGGAGCRLLQYLVTEDGRTLGIMLLNPKAAAAHLSRLHPKRDKIAYPPQTGDVFIKALDDEVKSVLADGMLGSTAWESQAILLRVR
ncbi:hypothetical protein NX068_17750 [Thauera sp. Sel9]|nr:hypothetical protein [Thauera sp. Sel9]